MPPSYFESSRYLRDQGAAIVDQGAEPFMARDYLYAFVMAKREAGKNSGNPEMEVITCVPKEIH